MHIARGAEAVCQIASFKMGWDKTAILTSESWEIRPWVITKCFICSVSTNPSYSRLRGVMRVITSSCSCAYVTHRWRCIYLGTLFPRCTSAFSQSTLTWEPPPRATHDKTRSTVAKRAYLESLPAVTEHGTLCDTSAWIHISHSLGSQVRTSTLPYI